MKILPHLERMQASYIREILSAATAKGVISLAGGLPASDSFPLDIMAPSLAKLSQRGELFQYGETAGYTPLLNYLKSKYALLEGQNAMICTGSQQGLDLIARTFLDKNTGVALEEPAYLGALQVFAMTQARIEAVPQTLEGPDLNRLEELFATGRIKIFYIVPDFHNPTGVSWSLNVRQHVAALCRKYGVSLIEDSPYRDLCFDGQALPLVSSFCMERSLVLRSFSKIAAPGMRTGFVSGPKRWVEQLVKVKQAADLHSNLPMQAILLDLLQSENFPQHLLNLRSLYKKRYLSLSNSLRKQLHNCHFEPVGGGMFIWLRLPGGKPMNIAAKALESGVAVVPAEVFYPDSTKQSSIQPALRLNFSHASERNLDKAVNRLSKVIRAELC